MRNSLILSLAVLLTITSCKKSTTEEEKPQATKQNCKLMQTDYKSSNEGVTYNYNYYQDGKIASYKGQFNAENYTYGTNSVIISTNGGMTRTYTLDNNNRASRYSELANVYHTLTYNADGYLIQDQTLQGSLILNTEKYTYTNGNLTSFESGNRKTTIEYGTEIANSNFFMDEVDANLPLLLVSPIKIYLGKLSTNLPIKATEGTSTRSFSYVKDSNGNVTKVTVTIGSGGNYTLEKKYNCN